jgi:hypothetical protein
MAATQTKEITSEPALHRITPAIVQIRTATFMTLAAA